jgi:hypothetical protein
VLSVYYVLLVGWVWFQSAGWEGLAQSRWMRTECLGNLQSVEESMGTAWRGLKVENHCLFLSDLRLRAHGLVKVPRRSHY